MTIKEPCNWCGKILTLEEPLDYGVSAGCPECIEKVKKSYVDNRELFANMKDWKTYDELILKYERYKEALEKIAYPSADVEFISDFQAIALKALME